MILKIHWKTGATTELRLEQRIGVEVLNKHLADTDGEENRAINLNGILYPNALIERWEEVPSYKEMMPEITSGASNGPGEVA